MPFLLNHINEMAMPRSEDLAKTYYHGTSNESNALKIIKEGIKPPEITNRKSMTPVKGKIYITTDLSYAQIYALGGNMAGEDWNKKGYGYIFSFSGKKLKDIQPDEDNIGEIIYNNKNNKNEKLNWLINLFNNNTTQNQKRKVLDGDYASWAAVGKKLVKLMTDNQKLQLIDLGAHIAHEGNIFPDKAYKINLEKTKLLKKDASNFFKYAEPVTL